MKPSIFASVCVLLSLATPAVSQSSLNDWYLTAEELRRDAGSLDELQKSKDIHYQLIKRGFDRSLVPYAEIHLELDDIDTAMRAFDEAASTGNLFAITRVAQAHATGAFGEKSQPKAGVDLLRKLAVNPENRRAILALADVLVEGNVIEADPFAALALYRRLPDDRSALRSLADLYMSGALGSVDAEAATAAYAKAIELGSTTLRTRLARAQLELGQYEAAMETLRAAIADQDERALLQMVRWHRDGAFGPLTDPELGLEALEDLIAAGTIEPEIASRFRVSLAGQLLREGRFTLASNTLAPAVLQRDRRALYRFMRWHSDGEFGPVSDPVAGLTALRELIEMKDVDTAIFASFRLQDPIYAQAIDRDTVLDILAEATRLGDGAATRALARIYRKENFKGPHRALIAEYAGQIELDERVMELIYASYTPANHRLSRERAMEILSTVRGQAFVKGMMQLRSLERTSYVYVLQAELKELGYYRGSQNGKLTTRTIRAMLEFCRDSGFLAECRSGPISQENSLLIVEAIAQRKRVAS